MAAKSRIRVPVRTVESDRVVFLKLNLFLWLLLFQAGGSLSVNAHWDLAKHFLDQKEMAVKWVAGNASLNNANCGSLDGCSAGCSRVTCNPVSGGAPPQCISVDNNEYFGMYRNGAACKGRILFDYNRSFVTLPPPASLNLSTEVARDICLQRRLDSTFKDVSLPVEYSQVYFGSISGAFRAFPGLERTEDRCTSFDPRIRPWYVNHLRISRDVKIALDTGNRMGNVVSPEYYKFHPPGTTYLDVAKDITSRLLQTFSPDDSVEVFSFDNSYVGSLGGSFNTSYNVFDGLLASVYNLTASPDASPFKSDLDSAILMAAKSFNTVNSLKVIIVLTSTLSSLSNSTIFPSLELQLLQAKLMVYSLPTESDEPDENPLLLNTPSLQENICSVNGFLERLNPLETANPLYSINSYFTFLARAHLASVAFKATWSYKYESFSLVRNIVTVTYPAFGSNGLLIGVAGIDVAIDNLPQPLKDLVYTEYKNRTTGTVQAAPLWRANFPLTCNYQSSAASAICRNSTLPDSSAICARNDTSSTFADRMCCGACSSGEDEKSRWVIELVLIAAVAMVLAVAGSYKFKTRVFKVRSSFSPVDILDPNLCDFTVHEIEGLLNRGRDFSNRKTSRQCHGFSSKLSEAVQTIREIVFQFKASIFLFKPILQQLYQDLERAKLNLCEIIVHHVESRSGWWSKPKSINNMLNGRQCLDLSSKLSRVTENVREIVFHCGVRPSKFRPALEKLYVDLERAKFLVIKCGEGDWCTESVFQSHNEIAFREILLDVEFCYHAIYEQARSLSEENHLPEDLRQSDVFTPASKDDVHEDQVDLQERLEAQANGQKQKQGSLKQCLARYLLAKLIHRANLSEAKDSKTLSSPLLWAQETEPPGTWGSHSCLLGQSGSLVFRTKWMGIPCAKKEFLSDLGVLQEFFLNEASILAQLKHPRIVDFFCCGYGKQKGKCFIVMELMEKSLSDLIKEEGRAHFTIHIVVDIMVQISRGMCYLHGQGIAHLDLKPQNVVVSVYKSPNLADYYDVKLVDFGTSKAKVQVSKSDNISFPGIGTPYYRAPELHREARLDGISKANYFRADVFSFAMTCAHILNLKVPLGSTKKNELYKNLKNGVRPELPEDCPEELKKLLEDCWNENPRSRPSFDEIWIRLEIFRHNILRGLPASKPSLQQWKSDTICGFIAKKIQSEHLRTCRQKPFHTISIEIEGNIQSGLPIGREMESPTLATEAVTPETIMEMTMQRSSRQRSFSF